MNALTKQDAGAIAESVIVKGDLSKLNPAERAHYYTETCRSLRLNPLTRPLQYIVLNGQLQLYATKAATDQLRKIYHVSIEVLSQTNVDGLYTVHVQAKDAEGRTDEDFGVVSLPDTAKGDLRANLILKAVTKAKRRVTLSICGLGFLDETEVEDIPAHAKRPAEHFNDEIPNFAEQVDEKAKGDAAPDEVQAPQHPKDPGAAQIETAPLQDRARAAAKKGEKVFYTFYRSLNDSEKGIVDPIGTELRELMSDAQ